jgi:hypothetical protein
MKIKKSSKRNLAVRDDDDDEDNKTKKKDKPVKGYSTDLDKCVKEIGRVEGDGGRGGDIVVRLMSYNKGPVKISVGMTGTKANGDEWFAKLGRITGAQCEALIPLMRRAVKKVAKYEEK